MDFFWSEWFWLKPGLTWEDYQPKEGISRPDSKDLWFWPFLFMAGLLLFRNLIVIRFVFVPLGKYMGVRSKPYSPPPPHTELEKLFKVNRARPPKKLLESYASEVGMSERQIERWLRRKTVSQQKTTLEKFCDFGWEFTYYTFYCVFGLVVVATEPWCYDIGLAFENHPSTSISTGVWWYFMMAFGFYMAQTYLLFTQTRRFDFNWMLIHHLCTMGLMSFCWILGFARLSALSLLIHECADISLAFGKLLYYCGKTRISDLMSIPFCIVWFSTRLMIYPFHLLRGCIFDAPKVLGPLWPAGYFLNVLQTILLVLHVLWSMEIIKSILIKLKNGTTLNDRDSPEEMSEEEVVPHQNGTAKKIK